MATWRSLGTRASQLVGVFVKTTGAFVLLAFVLTGSVLLSDPQPAMATAFSNTYPTSAQNAVGCSAQFGIYSWCVGTPNAKGVWPKNADLSGRGYGYRNCTDYVAWEIQQVYGITLPSSLGNGNTWGAKLQAAGYTYDRSPQVGDIAAWNTGGGGFGHVAYIYAVSGGVASLAEYNYAGTGAFTSNRTVSNSSPGAPSEWIHIGTPPSGGGGAGSASDASRLTSFLTSDGIMHVFSATPSGVFETYWGPGVNGKQTDPINSLGGVDAVTSFLTSDGIMHVFSATPSGVFETYWGPGVNGKQTDPINSLGGL
jgi:surface antigen